MSSRITQIILISVAVTILSLLYFFYPATSYSFHPKCVFHVLTGLYCPGCGSQRAASALLHGNLLAAIDYNVLFVICLPLILYSAFVFTWNTFSEKKKFRQRIFYSPLFVKFFFVVVVCFWVLRNLPIAPFTALAP